MSPQHDVTLLEQCKMCLRTIWSGSLCPVCYPPPPVKEQVEETKPAPEYKPKTRDKR